MWCANTTSPDGKLATRAAEDGSDCRSARRPRCTHIGGRARRADGNFQAKYLGDHLNAPTPSIETRNSPISTARAAPLNISKLDDQRNRRDRPTHGSPADENGVMWFNTRSNVARGARRPSAGSTPRILKVFPSICRPHAAKPTGTAGQRSTRT